MQVQDIDPAFGNWLAGFIDGEGSFQIRKHSTNGSMSCLLHIKLRRDDEAILHEIARQTGCGTVRYDAARPSPGGGTINPGAHWQTNTLDDGLVIVALLDRFPLRAKKARDYAIWREAVLAWRRRKPPSRWGARRFHNDPLWQEMLNLKHRLAASRSYDCDPVIPPDKDTDQRLFSC